MDRKEWIKYAIENHIKKCGACKKWTTFHYEELNEDYRLKICDNCGFKKKLEIAKAFFRTIDGITERLEKKGWKVITHF